MTQKADDIEIKEKAAGDDIEAICDIERACFSDPWSYESIKSELDNPFGLYAIAYDGTRVVGYIMGTVLYEDCDINNVAVLPEYRRRGVGRRMMESFLVRCRGKGAKRVLLEVRESNLAAIGLYSAFGFAVIGKRRDYYDDPREDAVLMEVEIC